MWCAFDTTTEVEYDCVMGVCANVVYVAYVACCIVKDVSVVVCVAWRKNQQRFIDRSFEFASPARLFSCVGFESLLKFLMVGDRKSHHRCRGRSCSSRRCVATRNSCCFVCFVSVCLSARVWRRAVVESAAAERIVVAPFVVYACLCVRLQSDVPLSTRMFLCFVLIARSQSRRALNSTHSALAFSLFAI